MKLYVLFWTWKGLVKTWQHRTSIYARRYINLLMHCQSLSVLGITMYQVYKWILGHLPPKIKKCMILFHSPLDESVLHTSAVKCQQSGPSL